MLKIDSLIPRAGTGLRELVQFFASWICVAIVVGMLIFAISYAVNLGEAMTVCR